MAYTFFQNSKPDILDPGSDVIDDARTNDEALRDAIVAGALKSWPMTVTAGTGTAEEPQYLIWKNGVLWIRATITWGTSGGADGNPTSILYEFSGNSGGLYDTIGTITLTYDASGNNTGSTWA